MSKDEQREIVMKTAYEILQEKDFITGKEVAERSGVNSYKAVQILRHNFYRRGLLKGRKDHTSVYVKKESKNLPPFIKIETTPEELEKLEFLDRARELAKKPKPHKKIEHLKRKEVTPELVDVIMDDLKKQHGEFSYQDIMEEMCRVLDRVLNGDDKVLALRRYEQRIEPGGRYQKYEFRDGYAQ
jgi:hypothetical protein